MNWKNINFYISNFIFYKTRDMRVISSFIYYIFLDFFDFFFNIIL